MLLPHIDEAYVPEAKLSGYLLAADHASGRSKALFLSRLGFRSDQPDVLRRALLQHAADNAVSSVQLTPFGAKYLIEGRISGSTGTAAASIRSVWFVEIGERSPRFVTAYPLRGTQK
jgi:hypothetical protein